MKLGVVVLAAGQGTRMRSDIPKVLHTLAGKPLLAHVIETAQALQPARICVVYGHGGESVIQALAGCDVCWVEQADQQGTGHAAMQALPAVGDLDRLLILYGDIPLIRRETLRALLQCAEATDLALLTVTLEDPGGYGRILRDAHGQVRRIVEQRDASSAELAIKEINTGIMVVDRAKLSQWLSRLGNDNAQGEYYLTDVIELAAQDAIAIATVQPASLEEVAGVNDRAQLAALERFYQRRQAEHLMRSGVTLADPARFDLRGALRHGRDVFLDVNVVLEGEVQLGHGVRVGPNCVLRDCAIGAGTQVFANSVIEQARVGEGARIGPFSRIRPEADLADQVHIGNFVEIKKSRVGVGSKINHLSYLGDTDVGSGVNIGAGTITCNYDGAHKYRTVIGDEAFIGSDTQLVAPVTIGSGATIGAGSTITRDAPSDRLTLSRTRQFTVEGWVRPRKDPK